jgi:uncharacterized membrane protein YfcA
VTQAFTMAYLLARGMVGHDFILDYTKMLPAIMTGTFVGVHLFTKISELLFRRLVLLVLLMAGAAHAGHALIDLFAGRGGT